ncbi:hypothetical protein LK533_08065 [Sphingomonas sp. PL-96]|uniref:hypothetical protein n=1 Tax=Sphingomonas sp. PL-96 TaxID=2887201 RepID=UPI001E536B67|nr:hypothetical protein [Sphingomonas sp. PL-96]MCC2976629.1 hypothetical protein [Sphingomonas sp. PL-96]
MKAHYLMLLCLAGCGNIPKDPEGTLDRIRRQHVIRVGRVEGGLPPDALGWHRVLTRVEASTGAEPIFQRGMLEPLLLDLEAGKLDVVVGGRFDEKTPWKTRVTLGPPIGRIETPTGKTASHIVVRNGENAWIMLVQRETKAAGKKP